MTLAEKQKAIIAHCDDADTNCLECPLRGTKEPCYEDLDFVERNYEMIFGPDTSPVNTCVSCGAEIPEGRLVCQDCEEYDCETCAFNYNSASEEPCVNCKNNLDPSDPRYESTPLKWKPIDHTEPDPIETDRPANMQVMSCEEHKENTLGKIRESVNLDPIKPEYYNDTKITPFDVIDDWGLNFYLGNAVKYIKRAGKKAGNSRLQDLKKVREYIDHEIRAEEAG